MRKDLTTSSKSIQMLEQFATSLTGISDFLQGCPITDCCNKIVKKSMSKLLYILTVPDLLGHPCIKSDSPTKLVTSFFLTACSKLWNNHCEHNLCKALFTAFLHILSFVYRFVSYMRSGGRMGAE